MTRNISVAVFLTLTVLAVAQTQKSDSLSVVEETDYHLECPSVPIARCILSPTVTVKAILPDGSHALLRCSEADEHCFKIKSFTPEKMPLDSQKCERQKTDEGITSTCVTSNLGSFRFKRSVNTVTIVSASGKSQMEVISSW